MRARCVLAIACILFGAGASAFSEDALFFSTLGARDGLPNSSVSGIAQDRRGFLWFGTQGGVVRYDGYSFKTFESEPFEADSLSHNQVQTLFLDGDVLWIGTYAGLNRLDLLTEKLTVFRHDRSDDGSLSNELIISIGKDSAGSLWVGTFKGLNRLDESTGKFTRYLHSDADPASIGADVVRDIHTDRNGALWVATSGGGLSRYDPASDSFRTVRSRTGDPSSLPSDAAMSIAEGADGSLWIGTWGGGVSRLVDPEAMAFRTYKLDDNRVYFVNAQIPGRILAGSWGGGLFEIDTGTGAVARRREGDGPGSIASDVVYSALLDEGGTLWVGTNGGGVSRAEQRGKRYQAQFHDSERPESLSAGKVSAIAEDKLGRLWVGVYNGGLNRWDPKAGAFVHYRHDPKDPRSLGSDIVNLLFLSAAGDLWVATNDGLCRYDYRTDDFTVYRHDDRNPRSIADSVVYSLEDAPGGDLWVGTYTKGLDRWERASDTFVHYPADPSGSTGPTDSLVYALEYDAGGTLWLGLNSGLNRLVDGKFIGYRYDPSNRKGISSDTVRNIFADSRGRLWFGTVGGGLMRYEAETDTFAHFTKRDGLPHNMVRSILEADDGSLWIGTATGLGVVGLDGTSFRGYSVFNDLKDRDFHTGAWKASDGSLYFGGMSALYRLSPQESSILTRLPRLLVSDIRSGGKPIRTGRAASVVERIDLDYNRNDFTVVFATNDFRDPGRNLYSFKLEGFDKEWSPVSADHSATYTNLPGGDYVFRVRAADNEGYWNDSALALPVSVSSPPWLTPPAYLSYLFVLIGLGYLVASLRGKRELSAKVVELTRLKVELEAVNSRLADLSMIDGLTGIPNRRKLDEVFPRLFADAVRERHPIAVLMLDLDFFKGYNDKYGHLKGDEALREVATVIDGALERATDLAARFGGEEFIVVLPNTDRSGAVLVAERIRLALAELALPTEASSVSRFVTLSVGIAVAVPEVGQSGEALIEAADAALYRAKTEGRDRIC
jgi:diguanylate cyclase (GGDEF)-like protein